MSITGRHIGFHPPLTLPTDAIDYADAIETVQKGDAKGKHASSATATEPTAIPGNDAEALARVRLLANEVLPVAKEITALEAKLSALYASYDQRAVGLWHALTEARDYADTFATKHDRADVRSVVDRVVYHAGRAVRHDLVKPAQGSEQAGAKPPTSDKG